MKGFLAAIALVLAVACQLFAQAKAAAPAKSAGVEQELIKLSNEWNDAMAKRDVAKLDRILSDDWVSAGSEEAVATKAQFLADVKSGAYSLSSTVVNEMKARVYGNAAVVITHYTTVGERYKGKDVSGSYWTIDTWIRRGGRWQCIATAGSRIAQK
jgi:hypothetical protein